MQCPSCNTQHDTIVHNRYSFPIVAKNAIMRMIYHTLAFFDHVVMTTRQIMDTFISISFSPWFKRRFRSKIYHIRCIFFPSRLIAPKKTRNYQKNLDIADTRCILLHISGIAGKGWDKMEAIRPMTEAEYDFTMRTLQRMRRRSYRRYLAGGSYKEHMEDMESIRQSVKVLLKRKAENR